MQYYELETVTEPKEQEAVAAKEVAARVDRLLASDDAGIRSAIGIRIVSSRTLGERHLLADVDLDGFILPIDMGTWALYASNYDKAAQCVAARAREALRRREDIRDHLAGLRARVQQALILSGGGVRFVDLHFWPIEGSGRLNLRELRLELTVEQFNMKFERVAESYHGYGIRDLTSGIRDNAKLQQRIGMVRQLLELAGVPLVLDDASQMQLALGKTSAGKIADRLIAVATKQAGRS